ncbi:MAG: hypothetical protein HFE25_07370 [Clostridia bacterium]|nr:hypothetical protein [Clostridia bacterium]
MPRITYKNGISAWIAPAPSRYTFPKIKTAQAHTIAVANSEGNKICLRSFPASIKTGAARKAFKPAYITPPNTPLNVPEGGTG